MARTPWVPHDSVDVTAVVTARPNGGHESTGPRPGTRVGRYLVIEEVGRGGMGVVLRAYDPSLEREVALKLVRTDILDGSAQDRLVREARAMARLNHPNVVAVYDVEQDPSGVVLVMELVPGVTLRRWLEAEPRSYEEIVAAFLAAGRGLAAAHVESLTHRDFKLDNVLVGNDGRVRVTDFGLARATRPSGSSVDASGSVSHAPESVHVEESEEQDSLTQTGAVMGTPAYMAPEQSAGAMLDARADQYAFCVALWRALTRRWPFEGRGRALVHAKESGPPRWPSDIVAPRHVVEALRRGLSPDPNARWQSLPALLEELERDPSRRRRRAIALGLVAAIVPGVWAAERARHVRVRQACVAEHERVDVVWNPTRAQSVSEAFERTEISYAADIWDRSRRRLDGLVEDWKEAACALVGLEPGVSEELVGVAQACLTEHLERLDAVLEQLVEADASVVHRVGTAVASFPPLTTCLDESRLRHRAALPEDPSMRAKARALQGQLAMASAARAAGRATVALEIARDVLHQTADLSWEPLRVEALLAESHALSLLGRYEDAQQAYEATFLAAGAAGRDEVALWAASELAFIVGYHLSRHDEGLRWGRIGEMLVDRMDLEGDLAVARLFSSVGSVHSGRGAYADALAFHERALAMRMKTMGAAHPEVAISLNNIGSIQQVLGDHEAALASNERALEIWETALGPEHPNVAVSLNNLGSLRETRGELELAVVTHERALSIRARALGPEHPDVGVSMFNLASAHHARKEYEQAMTLYERASVVLERALGPEHPHFGFSVNNMGLVHQAQGRLDEAMQHFQRAERIWMSSLGAEHPHVAMVSTNIGEIHDARGEHDDARTRFEQALAITERSFGSDHPDLARALERVGRAHALAGDEDRAAQYYERAVAVFRATGSEDETVAALEAWLASYTD